MATGDLLTAPWQAELREVLMDSGDCDEPLVVTEFLDGFGVPDTRNQDVPRPHTHGLFASPQYLGGRSMLVSVAAQGDTWAELLAAQIDLGAAWAPVEDTDPDHVIPLAFTLGDASQKYVVFGKPQRAAFGYQTTLRLPAKAFTDAALCEFLATDPRIYGLTLHSATALVGATTGGWGWAGGPGSYPDDGGWPHGWGSAVAGSASCLNAGNIGTPLVVTIAAGASAFSNPTVSLLATGEVLGVAITLAAGDTLVLDFAEQTALLNGTANRANLVTRPPSTWWHLPPGNNTVQLAGTGSTGSATIEWRDAYLL